MQFCSRITDCVFFPHADGVKDGVKRNVERVLTVTENSVDVKKVVDSNGHEGTIHGRSERHCSKETLNGMLFLITMPLCCWFHICFSTCLSPVCLNYLTTLVFNNLVQARFIFILLVPIPFAATNKVSKPKRKHLMDGVPSARPAKALKIAYDASKVGGQVTMTKRKSAKSKLLNLCPRSDGCARTSIDGWKWHKWSLNASPADRARVRGNLCVEKKSIPCDSNSTHWSNGKGLSARTNRVKLRNLLAAADGAELLKATQLKVIEE